jgi:4-hydroxymandelate oxidase
MHMVEERGDPAANLKPGIKVIDIPDDWRCPVCGMPKTFLQQVSDEVFSLKWSAYAEPQTGSKDLTFYRNLARKMLTAKCGVYPVCDGQPGRICTGQKFGAPIGLGGAGQGKTFEANYNALQQYRFKMRVIKAHQEPEMTVSIFGRQLAAPVMGASLSGVKASLNDTIPEEAFYRGLLKGAQAFGSISMVGNTPTSPEDLGVTIVGENGDGGFRYSNPSPRSGSSGSSGLPKNWTSSPSASIWRARDPRSGSPPINGSIGKAKKTFRSWWMPRTSP